jgi:FAD/FMN-containing dehydrogenase
MRPWLAPESLRNHTLVEQLDKLPSSYFDKLGISRQVLEQELKPFQGELIFPDSPEYDQARRLYNPRFDLRPALVACCICDSDVRICLRLVREFRVQFRIRAGGHSVLGYSEVDGGLVIDLSGLNDVSINPVLRMVTVGSGAQFEKIYGALEDFSAHIPGGECPNIAVGGFMQGGGYSLSSRTFGMNCDNVLSVRIMLADGRIVRASERTHHDLWWAVRGGTGNNFGVVLSVTYRLQRLDTAYGWRLYWRLTTDLDRQLAADALVSVQQTFGDAPREFNIQASVQYREVTNGVAEAQLWVYGAYLGPSQQGRNAIAPLRELSGAFFEQADAALPVFSRLWQGHISVRNGSLALHRTGGRRQLLDVPELEEPARLSSASSSRSAMEFLLARSLWRRHHRLSLAEERLHSSQRPVQCLP